MSNEIVGREIANDAVALFDLTAVPPTHLGNDITTNGVVRDYEHLADAMVLTDTYAVTLGAINGGLDWQADVYAISTSGTPPLNKVRTLTGTGQPHDIDRSSDGSVVVIRTTEHVVVLKSPLASPLQRWDIASPSLEFKRDATGIQYDSIAVTRKWAEQSSGGPLVTRHYAVALARDPSASGSSVPDTARFDVIDLTLTVGMAAQWRLDDDNTAPILPSSLRMLPGGQMVSVCSVGAPYDIDPADPNTPIQTVLAGTDAFVFDLRGQTGGGPMVGKVFQCERQGWPQVSSDPMEAIPVRSVSLSIDLATPVETGYIHTVQINP